MKRFVAFGCFLTLFWSMAASASLETSMLTEGSVYSDSSWIRSAMQESGKTPLPMLNTLGEYPVNDPMLSYTGSIRSPAFTAGRSVVAWVGGTLDDPLIRFGLIEVESDKRYYLQPIRPFAGVEMKKWHVPSPLRGKQVILFAEDHNELQEVWIGFKWLPEGVPLSYRWIAAKAFLLNLLQLLPPALVFIFIALTGYTWVAACWPDAKHYAPAIGMMVPVLLSYATFYTYLPGPPFGMLFAMLSFVAFAIYFLLHRSAVVANLQQLMQQWTSIALVLLLVLLSYAVLHLEATVENAILLAQQRFVHHGLPLDNFLPYLTASQLFDGDSLKPYIIEWRSTDRPPLHAAVCLYLWPFFFNKVEVYQLFSCLLFASFIPALLGLLKAFRLCARSTALILCIAIFSGTVLFNITFVWSKFFPVFFLCLNTTMLLRSRDFEKGFGFWMIFGVNACLALLAHSGSIFAIVPMVTVYSIIHRRIHLNQVMAAVTVGILLILPWLLFQKMYDPPGNMMQKIFLANHWNFDDVSLLDALVQSYSNLSLNEWLRWRWLNLLVVLGDYRIILPSLADGFGQEYLSLRNHIFNFIGTSFFPLTLFFPIGLWSLRDLDKDQRHQYFCLAGFFFFGLFLWGLIMLPPGLTNIHHGSYYYPMLLYPMLGVMLSRRPAWLTTAAIINGLYFAVVWLLPRFKPIELGNGFTDVQILNPLAALLVLVSMGLTVLVLIQIGKSSKSL